MCSGVGFVLFWGELSCRPGWLWTVWLLLPQPRRAEIQVWTTTVSSLWCGEHILCFLRKCSWEVDVLITWAWLVNGRKGTHFWVPKRLQCWWQLIASRAPVLSCVGFGWCGVRVLFFATQPATPVLAPCSWTRPPLLNHFWEYPFFLLGTSQNW